jgi:hypothetical protein
MLPRCPRPRAHPGVPGVHNGSPGGRTDEDDLAYILSDDDTVYNSTRALERFPITSLACQSAEQAGVCWCISCNSIPSLEHFLLERMEK